MLEHCSRASMGHADAAAAGPSPVHLSMSCEPWCGPRTGSARILSVRLLHEPFATSLAPRGRPLFPFARGETGVATRLRVAPRFGSGDPVQPVAGETAAVQLAGLAYEDGHPPESSRPAHPVAAAQA